MLRYTSWARIKRDECITGLKSNQYSRERLSIKINPPFLIRQFVWRLKPDVDRDRQRRPRPLTESLSFLPFVVLFGYQVASRPLFFLILYHSRGPCKGVFLDSHADSRVLMQILDPIRCSAAGEDVQNIVLNSEPDLDLVRASTH